MTGNQAVRGQRDSKIQARFGNGKPMIAMVYFGALPGSPRHDAERGIDGLIDGVSGDIDALPRAGFGVVYGSTKRL